MMKWFIVVGAGSTGSNSILQQFSCLVRLPDLLLQIMLTEPIQDCDLWRQKYVQSRTEIKQLKILNSYLESKNETRHLSTILLKKNKKRYVAHYFQGVCRNDGTEYEPDTLMCFSD